jgi:hypothetical protein
MKKIFLTLTFLLVLSIGLHAHAATVLNPGDIIIVSVNSDGSYPGGANSNGFDFVSRVDLDAGTQIYFADKSWDGSLATPFWRNTTGEGLVRYTVPAGGISRGTIVHYDDTMIPVLPTSGSGLWDMYAIDPITGALTLPTIIPNFELANAGDNILVFQDPTNTNSGATPNFIYGIGFSGTTTWISSGTPTTNNSWIPSGISTAGGTVVTLGSTDNQQYNCTVTGLFNTSLTNALQTTANWNTSDTVPYAQSTCVFDASRPAVTINQSAGQADPTNNAALSFTVVFSEAINPATFTAADISLSGTGVATVGTPTTSDNITWTVPVTATGNGTIIASLAASVVTDVNSNPNLLSTSTDNTITYDSTAPTINQVTPVITPTGDTTPDYTFSSTETGSITYGGSCGSMTSTTIVGNNTITFNTLPSGTYTNCTIMVTDTAGNMSNIITVSPFTIDATLPTLVLSGDTSTTSVFTVTITPSESVTGLTLSDLVVTNGTASNLVGPDGLGKYTVTITPVAQGTVTVQIPSSSVTDASNNTNTASNVFSTTYVIPVISSSSGVRYCSDTVTTFCAPRTTVITAQSIDTMPTKTLGKPGQCSADLLITQDMRAGARNGRINNYSRTTITNKEVMREVKILQTHMNRLGFNSGQIDGILGPVTDGAIKRMQKFLGTYQDGRVGPITRSLINNSCGE